jgi:hypothetical protein
MIERHRSLDSPVPSDEPRPPVRVEVDPARRRVFTWFSVLVLAGGIAVSLATSVQLPFEYRPDLLIIGPLLALGFLLAEQLTIDVDVKRVGWTISFTEIPLILGLLTVPFEVVLAANLLAGLGAQVGRRAATHVAYNAGVFCLEIAVPFGVAHLVNATLGTDAPPWFGAALGTLTSPLISCGFALAALHVLGGEMRITAGGRLAVRTLAVGLFNTSVGLVGYEVAVSTPWGWGLVVLVSAAVIALYRAYSGLLREQRDLEALSDVSLSVARSGQAARGPSGSGEASDETSVSEWEPVAERIREQLNATRVVLRLRLDPRGEVSTLVAGEQLPDAALMAGPSALREDPLLQLPGSHVRSFRTLDAPDEVRRALRQRSAYESLVVPLRGASQLLGAVEVHDRVSRPTTIR